MRFLLFFCCLTSTLQAQLTVGDVVKRIQQNVTVEWASSTVDNLKSGTLDQEVTGIAITFMATLEVLRAAKAQNINLIITHEPTFYTHLDDREPLKNDPVQQAKIQFIEENGLIVFRYHDHLHRTGVDLVEKGIVKDLGWKPYQQGEKMIFHLPETSLKKLAKRIEKRFGNEAVRVVGDPKWRVSHVGVVPGAYGSYQQIAMLNQEVEVLIVGETREWETVEYARDAAAAGFKKALIVMGHADSEEGGMREVRDWLKGFIAEVPIEFIPAGNPLWSP